MTMANPYLKAVKNLEAIKDALKDPNNKKPIWIGPKKFNYGNVPRTYYNNQNIESNNRNLATLNMLNWFTHNSYLEIPMSQRMALYFDSRASEAISSGLSSAGSTIGGVLGSMGPAGVVGGMFGGPAGMVFGGLLGGLIGSKVLKQLGSAIGRVAGSVIGAAFGFIWNSSGKNSLSDNQKRQLPGFMCLLPKDKLEMYLKTLFHMSLYGGSNHARLPYNYLTTADNYPDKLAATLGRSEISFTFTLTDNMYIRNYDRESGEAYTETLQRAFNIGQDKEGFNGIPLIDEYARLADPFYSGAENPDKRIQ